MFAPTAGPKPATSHNGYFCPDLDLGTQSAPEEAFAASGNGRLVHLTAASLVCVDTVLNPLQCGHYLAGHLDKSNDTSCGEQRSDRDKRREQWAQDAGPTRGAIFPALNEDDDDAGYHYDATIRYKLQQATKQAELVRLRWPIESQDSLTSPAPVGPSRWKLRGNKIPYARQVAAPSYLASGVAGDGGQCACPFMSLKVLRRLKLASLTRSDSNHWAHLSHELSQTNSLLDLNLKRAFHRPATRVPSSGS